MRAAEGAEVLETVAAAQGFRLDVVDLELVAGFATLVGFGGDELAAPAGALENFRAEGGGYDAVVDRSGHRVRQKRIALFYEVLHAKSHDFSPCRFWQDVRQQFLGSLEVPPAVVVDDRIKARLGIIQSSERFLSVIHFGKSLFDDFLGSFRRFIFDPAEQFRLVLHVHFPAGSPFLFSECDLCLNDQTKIQGACFKLPSQIGNFSQQASRLNPPVGCRLGEFEFRYEPIEGAGIAPR